MLRVPSSRPLLRGSLVLVAAAALGVLFALALGMGGRLGSGIFRITINDYLKPLQIGALAAGLLLATSWGHRRWRLTGCLLAGALGTLAIVNFAQELPPITTASDLAATELYTALAADGRLMVGPYSRYGWHHPGPLYFYLQAPLYAAAGGLAASLYGGALLINLAAVLTILWVAGREDLRTGALLTIGCLLFAWQLPRLLASPWTAHVPVLPALTFVVLCAAMACGRHGLLPLAILYGSLAVQTHIALLPAVGSVALALFVLIARPGSPSRPRTWLLAGCATLALILWMPALGEAVSNRGGNLAALWTFFAVEPAAGQSVSHAFLYWCYGLAGVLRPDFELPWGARVVLDYAWLAVPVAVGQVLLLAAIASRDLRGGRTFEGSLGLASLLVCGAGLVACTRIRGDVRDHEILWLAAFGAFNLALIGNAGVRLLNTRLAAVPGRAAATAVGGLLTAVVVLLGVGHLRDFTAYELRRPERNVTLLAHEAIRDYLRDEGITRPLLVIEDGVWAESAGAVLRLYREGTPLSIAEPAGPMFRGLLPRTGTEDALIHLTRAGRHEQLQGRPSNRVLLDYHPVFVNALRLPPDPAR